MINSERHQHVMRILADAIECTTEEREELLAESCRGDQALRQEVERLLEHKHKGQEFLAEPLITVLGEPDDEEETLVGSQIGSYLILEEIGRGGMGTVYLARRSDDEYQRLVAIKLINRGISGDLVRRFRKERQILANLDHENIARLYDGGTTEDGRAFLVMEYIKGQPIDVYADAFSLSTTERIKLFLAVCNAVQYAHQNQIIHRDLKPSNILVNNEGVPKLLDFGIATFLKSNSSTFAADPTTSAFRLLTPEYASPEQICGEQGAAASDVYSLGAVLYELLTGHRPHPQVRQGSIADRIQAGVTREPEKPSSAINHVSERQTRSGSPPRKLSPEIVSRTREGSPERLRRRLRGDLDNVVLMALRSDSRRRYTSVEEFSDDLLRHLNQQPIKARKDSIVYRSRKFFQRNRTIVVSAIVLVVLSTLIGFSLNSYTASPKPAITSVGVLPFVNVGNDQQADYVAHGLTSSLTDYLSRLPDLRVPGHNSALRFKGQTIDAPAAARALNVDSLVLGRATTTGDTLSVNVELINAPTNQIIWSQRFDGKASDIFGLQRQIAADVAQNLGLARSAAAQVQLPQSNTPNVEAYRLYLQGDQSWNLRTYAELGKAVELFQAAIDQDPNYALAYSGLANSYGLLGAYRRAEPKDVFPKARTAALRALELDSNLAEAHTSMALVTWLYEWDWDAADQAFRRSIELKPSYVMAHHWYGLFLAEMGRFDEAIATEKRALELDPLSVYVNADLARVYFFARRYDEAIVQYRKTTEMKPDFGAYYAERAELYEQMAMDDEYITTAHPELKEAKEFRQLVQRGRESFLKKVWWRTSNTTTDPVGLQYFDLARVAARAGNKREAFQMLNRAFGMRDHLLTQLKVEPAFDSLRSDPRFVELLKRMKLN